MSNIAPNDDNFERYKGIPNPDQQEGLSAEIERGTIPVAYINRYISETDVDCAFCPQHQSHRRGFTAQMSDGRIALCGIDCGRRYFGDHAASRLEAELIEAEEAAHQAELLAKVTEGLPGVIEVLKNWISVEADAVSLLMKMPTIPFRFARDSLDRGIDYVFYKTERQMQRRPDGVMRPVEMKIEIGRVHEIRTIWDARGHFSRAKSAAESIMIGANKKGRKATVEERLEMREEVIRSIREGVDWLNRAAVFMNPTNLNQYCRLYRQVGDRDLKVDVASKKAGMMFRVRNDGEWQSTLIPELPTIPTKAELLGPLQLEV